MNDRPSYPWQEGDALFASELNAAIAGVTGVTGGATNVLAMGADPTGIVDCSAIINAAAAQMGPNGHRKSVYLPTGTYRVDHQILLTDGQTLFGDGEGSTNLVIYDNFDPAASSIVLCTPSYIDPGPTIRDLAFWFSQPNDVTSRSTFKTLAAGGTSYTPGGSGVKYPWAIDTQGNSGRIQVQHVAIFGAWDGINADKACFWIDGLKVSAFNIGVAIGGTLAAPVLDWTHVSDVEFWPFGTTTQQRQISMDGQTIAMRLGAMNGLSAQNISCFSSRLVFTSDASGGWFSFTNLAMDTGHATIEMADAFFAQFANVYYSTADNAGLPGISIAGNARVTITGFYAHSTSPLPLLQVADNADVSLVGAVLLPYVVTATTIMVFGTATLRLNAVKIYPGTGTWTAPLIMQNGASNLQINNVDVIGFGASGTAVQYNSDQAGNYLGPLSLKAGWSVVGTLPATTIATRTVMPALRASTTYANDAAAAAGGVGVGQLYRNGSAVQIRVT